MPIVKIFDQIKYCTQGYGIKELIENVETEWFAYLHTDVYLPKCWYDEMIKYKDRYDWYDCRRHFLYMFYDKNDPQINTERPWA